MTITEVYKVYGCDEEGRPILYAEFFDFKLACQYAYAQYGKIHYNLPDIEKHTYCYDEKKKELIESRKETVEPDFIRYMNKI